MNKLSTWQAATLKNLDTFSKEYSFKNGVYVNLQKTDISELTVWAQSTFYQRAQKEYTTTWAEQSIADEGLARALSKIPLDNDSIVIDAGCGDGRFVHYLLKNGYSKILAFNYEYAPLANLAASLTDDERQKVFLLCIDIFDHPFTKEFSDFALAWGLFSSTGDYVGSMDRCLDMIKVDGYLYNAEPILEQAIIYSLVMNDLEELSRIMETRSRARMWDQKDFRYNIYSQNEINHLMDAANAIEVVHRDGISVLPSLIFGGVCAAQEKNHADLKGIWDQIKKSDFSWCRQLTFLSRKVKKIT